MNVLAIVFTFASTAHGLAAWQNLPAVPVTRQVKVHVATTETSVSINNDGNIEVPQKTICEATVDIPLYDTTPDVFKNGYTFQPETKITNCNAIYNKKNVSLQFEGSMHIVSVAGVKHKEGVVRMIISSPGADDIERTAVVSTKTLEEASIEANMSDFDLVKIKKTPKDELLTTIEFTDAN